MTQEAKPVLNAESFQYLLAAAYMLQSQSDRRLSVKPIDMTQATPSVPESVTQHQIPAVKIQGQELRAMQPSTLLGDEAAKEHAHSGRLGPFVAPTFLRDVMSWKTVEAIAITIVFCAMMGLSIHSLSARPGDVSSSTGTLEHRNVSQPARLATRASASDRQTVMGRKSLRPGDDGEGDVIAKDTIIHFQNRSFGLHTADRPRPASSGRAVGTLTADRVVYFGPEVTMWLMNSKRVSPSRRTR